MDNESGFMDWSADDSTASSSSSHNVVQQNTFLAPAGGFNATQSHMTLNQFVAPNNGNLFTTPVKTSFDAALTGQRKRAFDGSNYDADRPIHQEDKETAPKRFHSPPPRTATPVQLQSFVTPEKHAIRLTPGAPVKNLQTSYEIHVNSDQFDGEHNLTKSAKKSLAGRKI